MAVIKCKMCGGDGMLNNAEEFFKIVPGYQDADWDLCKHCKKCN